MFEQELEMEQKEGSSFGPMIIILLLVAMFVGGIAWIVLQTRKTLKPEEASVVISSILKDQGPSYLKFHVGHITPDVNDNVMDPHYRLLVKAGLVTMTKPRNGISDVTLTAEGEKLLGSIAGVEKKETASNVTLYTVPLATRTLAGITNITKLSPTRFRVSYTWKWVPNALGDDFDAAGPYVSGFNTWDRSTLIDKYGAAFYHGDPIGVTVTLQQQDKEWRVVTD